MSKQVSVYLQIYLLQFILKLNKREEAIAFSRFCLEALHKSNVINLSTLISYQNLIATLIFLGGFITTMRMKVKDAHQSLD
jgi:hypothetical protein